MYAETESITVTVDASGDATVYSANLYTGVVRVAIYTKNNYANGVDFTITGEKTGQNIWTESDVNASKTIVPKQASHSTAGVAATYDGTRAVLVDVVLVNERIKIVVGSGGVSTTGAFRFVVG